MVRRLLFDEGLKFQTDFHLGEDVCLWLSLASRYSILRISSPLSVVQASPSAATYDKDESLQGIDNILRYIMGGDSLRHHTEQVERLRDLRQELVLR